MTQDIWDNILTLLAVMVMADGRVRGVELDAFANAVGLLQAEFEPDDPLPDALIRTWFDLNEERVRKLTLADPFDAAIMPYLSNLSDLPDRQILLDRLAVIADSDMCRDGSESDILTLAAAFWGLVRDNQPSM